MAGWRQAAYRGLRPLLFLADPERVHHLTLATLAIAGGNPAGRALCGVVAGAAGSRHSAVELLGLRFRNRIGLGAGFGKDGVGLRGWAALGFGFVELGTVTPRPQPGNPRPRLLRLAADEALVNRMGFNNAGADALASRIAAARPHLPEGFVIGVNIGRNRDTPDDRAVGDYVAAARAVAGMADYLAINVSSPNTPGLRDLQDPVRLTGLLAAVADAAPGLPLLVKLSPDLSSDQRRELLATLSASTAAGVILSNSTTSRDGLSSSKPPDAGGISGRPLRERTVAAVAAARGSGLTVIGSGGIATAADAARVLHSGADLVQLWTGMIYAGPGLIGAAVSAAAGFGSGRGRAG